MKSIEQQEAVTAKVQEAFAQFPTIIDLPSYSGEDPKAQAIVTGDTEADYVTALYELFYQDSTVDLVGRVGYSLIGN